MILNDIQITQFAQHRNMITPFTTEKVKVSSGVPVISYGLQSFGYDLTLGTDFAIFQPPPDWTGYVDPKNFDERLLRRHQGNYCMIPANSFSLGVSAERFKMPPNVTGIVLGKSTYARVGLIANFTPLEAGWEGFITIEMSNTSPLPVKVYAGEGFAQVLFFSGSMPNRTYGNGKYQGQAGITTAKV